VKNDYASLSDKGINVLLPFVTTYMYLCDTGLPAVAATMKTKQRLQLIIGMEIQFVISSIIS
jgi:hypothetical protein